MLFTTALFIATAVLALWLDHRMPQLAPPGIFWRAGSLVAAIFVCGFIPIATDSYYTLYGTVFGVLAPLLVFLWLSALWLLHLAADALESRY